MVKGIVFLLFLVMCLPAFASDAGLDLANIDKDMRGEILTNAGAPDVIEKYQYYEIHGSEERELRRQMSQNGTKWNDGKTYDALTSWSWTWNYDYNRTAAGCSPNSFRTYVDIVFRYPKWVRTDDAPQALTVKWESYMNNLVLHEKGHRDMAVEAAEEFSRMVAELPPAMSCAELDKKVKALGSELMAKLNANSREYDAHTVHGAKQGAVFP